MYKMIFSCNICNFYTLNRYDYKKHVQTKKHISKCGISHLDEPNNVNVKQLEEENCVTVEEGINKTEPAIEPYLKKKRGKKK